FGFDDQFVELAQQAQRQVVDAEKTPVLEGSEEGTLTRAAQAGDDDARGWLHVKLQARSNRYSRPSVCKRHSAAPYPNSGKPGIHGRTRRCGWPRRQRSWALPRLRYCG